MNISIRVLSTTALLLVLPCCGSARAQSSFGLLTVTPMHPTAGLSLSWVSGPSGTVIINRAPLGGAYVPIAMTTGTTFADSTASPNVIYSYYVSQGSVQSARARGVSSDITQPFTCPIVPQVPASQLGVDRVVSFKSANGTNISYTIDVPHANAVTVNVASCNGAGGCDDYTNVLNALATIKAAGSGTLLLGVGGFHFYNPPQFSNVEAFQINDLAIAGQPYAGDVPTTNLYFNNQSNGSISYGLQISESNRVLLKNFSIDWDFPNAIPGIVTTVGGVQQFNVQNPTYYIPNPSSPSPLYAITGYNFANGTYTQQTGARPGISAASSAYNAGGSYYTLAGTLFPVNAGAIGYVQTGPAIDISYSSNASLEGIRIYGGGGSGVNFYGTTGNLTSSGLRISNTKITKKPISLLATGEQPRFVALFGDNDLNGTLGNVLIESSEVAFVDDDVWASGGGFSYQVSSISTTEAVVTLPSQTIFHNQGANDILRFVDPATMAQIGSLTSAQPWTLTNVPPWTWTVPFSPAIPALAQYVGLPSSQLPFVQEPLFGGPNLEIVNSCFHDTHGRLYGFSPNILFDGVTVANAFNGGIVLASATFVNEGPGAQNIIVRNSNIIGAGYGQTDTNWLGGTSYGLQTGLPSAALSISATALNGFVPPVGYPNVAIQVYNNLISNSPGLAAFVAGADNVGFVNNTIADANSIAFQAGYNAAYCGANSKGAQYYSSAYICLTTEAAQGSVMFYGTTNLDEQSTPNTYLGTSAAAYTDVTVLNTNIVGGSFMQ